MWIVMWSEKWIYDFKQVASAAPLVASVSLDMKVPTTN